MLFQIQQTSSVRTLTASQARPAPGGYRDFAVVNPKAQSTTVALAFSAPASTIQPSENRFYSGKDLAHW
ncbi:MAG: hypothetical protein JO108_26705 [Acidobacteriaceae bacterium]|nr:hypothetical protein [Acidobacteriaceae bacterium]